MAKIYKRSDRIKVKIDDVVVTISPLTIDQKTEAQMLIAQGRIKNDYKLITKGIVQTIRAAVRDVDGLEQADGSKYKCVIEDDMLSQECVEDLFNIELHKKLTQVCTNLLNGFPKELVDENGKPIEGVSFEQTKKEEAETPN